MNFYSFNNAVMTHFNDHAPLNTRSVKSNSVPWFLNAINALCTERDKARLLFNKTKNP